MSYMKQTQEMGCNILALGFSVARVLLKGRPQLGSLARVFCAVYTAAAAK
jgi:hypothetical protein